MACYHTLKSRCYLSVAKLGKSLLGPQATNLFDEMHFCFHSLPAEYKKVEWWLRRHVLCTFVRNSEWSGSATMQANDKGPVSLVFPSLKAQHFHQLYVSCLRSHYAPFFFFSWEMQLLSRFHIQLELLYSEQDNEYQYSAPRGAICSSKPKAL